MVQITNFNKNHMDLDLDVFGPFLYRYNDCIDRFVEFHDVEFEEDLD